MARGPLCETKTNSYSKLTYTIFNISHCLFVDFSKFKARLFVVLCSMFIEIKLINS